MKFGDVESHRLCAMGNICDLGKVVRDGKRRFVGRR